MWRLGFVKRLKITKRKVKKMKDCIIETENLTKKYGNQSSVSNLNIHVRQGRIYGLLGRNGAGKTTTMKMLLGLTTPTSGKNQNIRKKYSGK